MKRRKHMFWGIYLHIGHQSVIKDNCISPRMLKKVIFIKNGWLFENKLILLNNKKNSRKTAFNVLITKKWAMLQPWGKRWIVENYLRSPKLILKNFFELYCVKVRIFITFESIGITVRRVHGHPFIKVKQYSTQLISWWLTARPYRQGLSSKQFSLFYKTSPRYLS